MMPCHAGRGGHRLVNLEKFSGVANRRDLGQQWSGGARPVGKTRPEGGVCMVDEKIKVRVTESNEHIEVLVLKKSSDSIQVVLGKGVHSVRCELLPTRTGQAYAGRVMGREIVYERSREQVQADIDRLNPRLKRSRP